MSKTAKMKVTVPSPAFASRLRREFDGLIEATLTCSMPEARKLAKILDENGLTDDANRVRWNADRYLVAWNKTVYGKTVTFEGSPHQISIRKSTGKNIDGMYLTKFEIGEIMNTALPMNFIRGKLTIESRTKDAQGDAVRRVWKDWERYAKDAIEDAKKG